MIKYTIERKKPLKWLKMGFKMKNEILMIRVSKELKKELEGVANFLGMSLSAFMRMASIEKASKIDVKKEKK